MTLRQNRINHVARWALQLSLLLFICPGVGLTDTEPQQSELDSMGNSAMTILLEHRPDLKEKLETLPGYAVISMSATKIPGVGTGLGYGVIVDSRREERSYIKVTQIELGGGLGMQKFRVIMLFKDKALLDRIIKGGWRFESGADFSSASESAGETTPISSKSGKGYKVFRLTESGALATITIRVLYARPYQVN